MQALDSTVLIELLKNPKLLDILPKDSEFCTTAINLFEIQAGLRNHEKAVFEDLKKNITVFSFEMDSSDIATTIYKRLLKKGKDIGKFDCMIAGCLLSHNVTSIITHNEKHFKNITELQVVGVK